MEKSFREHAAEEFYEHPFAGEFETAAGAANEVAAARHRTTGVAARALELDAAERTLVHHSVTLNVLKIAFIAQPMPNE
jgi:hypothetical protein